VAGLSTRTWALGAVALALIVAVGLRYGPESGGVGARSDEAVQSRIDTLRRVIAARSAVTSRYADTAAVFAERFATVATYETRNKYRADAVAGLIRSRLQALGPLQNLTVKLGVESPAGEGIRRATFNVSFTAVTDKQAIDALRMFAQAQSGLVWQTLALTADRKEHRVTVVGKLAALAVDPVE